MREVEKLTVMIQPHRRNMQDPASDWGGTAIGKFLYPRLAKDTEGTRELYDAAWRYWGLYNRWQRAKGVAGAYRDSTASAGAPDPTPEEQAELDDRVRSLDVKLLKLHLAMSQKSRPGFFAFRSAILDDMDVPPRVELETIKVIVELAHFFNKGLDGAKKLNYGHVNNSYLEVAPPP